MNSVLAAVLAFVLVGVATYLLEGLGEPDRAGACVLVAILCALFEERY